MTQRLKDKVALVLGAGSIGPGWGNGKATAVAYAREGARVLAVDLSLPAAEETAAIIRAEGGVCEAMQADVTVDADIARVVAQCMACKVASTSCTTMWAWPTWVARWR